MDKKAIVYRYTDLSDGIIKYVGIVHKSTLRHRIIAHYNMDDWGKGKRWKIEYFECANRSEAEAFESHLISLYGTGNYYNKAKKTWGINKYLPDVESRWLEVENSPYIDNSILQLSLLIKELLKLNRRDLIIQIMSAVEFVEE